VRKIAATFLVLFFAVAPILNCASVPLPKSPIGPPDVKDTELVPLPSEEVNAVVLPKSMFGRVALLKGEAAPGDGVLLDASEVARLALIKAERDRLRSDLLTEKRLNRKEKYIYERALWESEVKFIQSTTGFWKEYGWKIALTGGILSGVLIGGGLVYAGGQLAETLK